jgi:carbonic anhydrase
VFPTRLTKGYESFLSGRLAHELERYENLAKDGQKPEIMVIGCGDSRVAPETIFDAGPGEIFVIRNIANLVPPCENDTQSSYHGTSAAIEFAVNALQVKHIVVLGHASCGGVYAFANKAAPLTKRDFIGTWMSQIAPVLERVGPAGPDRPGWIRELEWGVVDYSLGNLMTFPAVRERVSEGTLTLHGAYFGVSTGVLFIRNPDTGKFEPYSQPTLSL